jgi:oligosaccharide repeat unit polymerase
MTNQPKAAFDFNPFFVYVVAFLLPGLLYQLDWSYLYPDLSAGLLIFLLITSLISIGIGFYVHKRRAIVYHKNIRILNFKWILIFITIGNIMDFAYQREIPLLSIVGKITVDNYGSFGIPTFGVLMSTFGGFITVYLFNCFLVTRRKKYLFASIYLFIFPLLIFSRGAILLTLSSMLFLYLFSLKGNKIKVYFRMLLIILLALLGFGYLGNIRTSNQLDKGGTITDIILTLGQAKPSFENSAIPKEFFWSYIYISSPLANLQNDIDKANPRYDINSVVSYLNYELIFDAVSKRTGALLDVDQGQNKLIAPYLTVSTIYATSFTDLGWLGMCLTFIALMAVCLLYLFILRADSPFFATGVAILNTMVLFCLFDNMISFTGLSFQLVYPILLSIKWRTKKEDTLPLAVQ